MLPVQKHGLFSICLYQSFDFVHQYFIVFWVQIFCLQSVQFSSVTQSCPTLCNPMDYSTPGFSSIINSRSLLKLMSIELVMTSNNLILYCPLLLPPSIFPSVRVLSNESGPDGTRCHDLSFLNVEFQANFSLSSFTFIKRPFSSSYFSTIKVVSSVYLRL